MIADHADCVEFIRALFAEKGVDVTISTAPPIIAGPYTEPGETCPHGTTYWFEPTGEQIARWARDGAE